MGIGNTVLDSDEFPVFEKRDLKPDYLGDKKEEENKGGNIQTNSLANISNLEDYIILPGKSHGTYSYPDSLVSMYRLGLTKEVADAGKRLGLTLEETASERTSSVRKYIGKINWEQALRLNLELSSFTLTPRQYIDFLLLLKSKTANDGSGKPVKSQKLSQIYEEVMDLRGPYLAEWLDAEFKLIEDKLTINYNHKIIDGKLQPQNSELLEDYLDLYCFDADLTSANKQGLPTRERLGEKFYFNPPRKNNNSVSIFEAILGHAGITCDEKATDSNEKLGVRRVFILDK